jgi:hypothetical protein
LTRYILSANHGYKIAVCMNGKSWLSRLCKFYTVADPIDPDFGDTTDIEGKH